MDSYSSCKGYSNTANETILVTVCSGISELTNGAITISPNPSDGNFILEYREENIRTSFLRVFDVSWKLVYSSLTNKMKTEINLEGVAAGCYLLQLKTGTETVYKKLIVQH